jgi:hypothetical protein
LSPGATPNSSRRDYQLPNYRTGYRHARATDVIPAGRENLGFAAELLSEHADRAQPSSDAILLAIGIVAGISGRGDCAEAAKVVVVSRDLADVREEQRPSAVTNAQPGCEGKGAAQLRPPSN